MADEPTPPRLLAESGDHLTTEDGDYLTAEGAEPVAAHARPRPFIPNYHQRRRRHARSR